MTIDTKTLCVTSRTPEPNWREIADGLAKVLEDYFCEDLSPSDKAIRASNALTTYSEAKESGQ